MTPDEVISLRHYFDGRLEALEKLIQVEFVLRDQAVGEARAQIDRRLDEMNELRRQIEGERNRYMTIATYEQYHQELVRRVGILENWRANLTGRAVGIGLIGGILLATVGAVIGHLIQ